MKAPYREHPVTDYVSPIPELLDGLEEFKRRLKGNPRCQVKNCYGRGWIGVIDEFDPKLNKRMVRLVTCQCATFGKTDYAAIADRLDALGEVFNQFVKRSAAIADRLDALGEVFNQFVKRSAEDTETIKRTVEQLVKLQEERYQRIFESTIHGKLLLLWDRIAKRYAQIRQGRA